MNRRKYFIIIIFLFSSFLFNIRNACGQSDCQCVSIEKNSVPEGTVTNDEDDFKTILNLNDDAELIVTMNVDNTLKALNDWKSQHLQEVQFRFALNTKTPLLYIKIPGNISDTLSKDDKFLLASTLQLVDQREVGKNEAFLNKNLSGRNRKYPCKKVMIDIDQLIYLFNALDKYPMGTINLVIGTQSDNDAKQPMLYFEVPDDLFKVEKSVKATTVYLQLGYLCPPPRTSSCQ